MEDALRPTATIERASTHVAGAMCAESAVMDDASPVKPRCLARNNDDATHMAAMPPPPSPVPVFAQAMLSSSEVASGTPMQPHEVGSLADDDMVVQPPPAQRRRTDGVRIGPAVGLLVVGAVAGGLAMAVAPAAVAAATAHVAPVIVAVASRVLG